MTKTEEIRAIFRDLVPDATPLTDEEAAIIEQFTSAIGLVVECLIQLGNHPAIERVAEVGNQVFSELFETKIAPLFGISGIIVSDLDDRGSFVENPDGEFESYVVVCTKCGQESEPMPPESPKPKALYDCPFCGGEFKLRPVRVSPADE